MRWGSNRYPVGIMSMDERFDFALMAEGRNQGPLGSGNKICGDVFFACQGWIDSGPY